MEEGRITSEKANLGKQETLFPLKCEGRTEGWLSIKESVKAEGTFFETSSYKINYQMKVIG